MQSGQLLQADRVAEIKILVVDDELFHAEMIKSLFENRVGCRVSSASNGLDAIDMMTEERPDLILMDLNMPQMNGYECCQIIKLDPALKDIPVIMLTASGDDVSRERAALAGCDDYLTKPVNMRDLLNKVNYHTGLAIRRHLRTQVDVSAIYRHDGIEFDGKIRNICEGGLYLESSQRLGDGSMVEMSFFIEGLSVDGVKARVAWSERSSSKGYKDILSQAGLDKSGYEYGMGLVFIEIHSMGLEAISRL